MVFNGGHTLTGIIIWWLVMLSIGILFLPLSNLIFGRFRDGGWLFSKAIGILVCAFLMWTANCLHLLKFSQANAWAMAAAGLMLNAVILLLVLKKNSRAFAGTSIALILLEEILFTAVFAAFVWIIGFKPEAYGTEKFMDYAFITSMLRSDYMPPADPWYAGSAINYYYGGQYVTAFLIRLSGVTAGVGYNLMRAAETAFSFALPFSLVYEMMRQHLSAGKSAAKKSVRTRAAETDTAENEPASDQSAEERPLADKPVRRLPCILSGLLSGTAVAFCGNFHYVIYGIILKLFAGHSYWFADSTRYIGYDPDTADKTIHEFPAYSTVLGDLHAHYLNIMFVITAAAVIYAWALAQKEKKIKSDPGNGALLAEGLLSPHLILAGFMTGLFRWTNFWDFPIYYVVCAFVIFFVNMRTYRRDSFRFIFITILNLAEVFLIGMAAALPFTLNFTMISSEIHLTTSHSAFYQLAILWGLPVIITVAFLITLIREFRKTPPSPGLHGFRRMLAAIDTTDLTAVLFGFCAIGLVILPELIYVKDIYGADHYRSNTMFKLTYQAFILFGIVMGYVLVRAFLLPRRKMKLLASAGIIFLLVTAGYTGNAIQSWFGNVFTSTRISTDASVFISETFPTDYKAIRWLNENVSGQPTILEANGDSYTDYARVSTATGLPTPLGWYVHEWLWRNDTDALNERVQDIQTIYTSTEVSAVESLIKKYNITYIYIGQLEREKFPGLNDSLLQSIGTVAYSDGVTTYIMKVDPSSF